VAAEVGQYPTLLGLDDLTGNRGSADKYLETLVGAMGKMDITDGKNVIALTTDNPKVMQSFRHKFQTSFHWVLVSIFQLINAKCRAEIWSDICVLSPRS
jgi:hypothetical protein